jgi:hypothetical protein
MNNNRSNFVYNTGADGSIEAGAGVGGGGASGSGTGASSYCFIIGAGCCIRTGTPHVLEGSDFVANNRGNFAHNNGGNSASGAGGAGVGSGAGVTVPSYCYMLGGGIYILSNSIEIQGCRCEANNLQNLSYNVGGQLSASVGAGVGDGGSATAGSGNCYIIGGGIYLSADGNTLSGCDFVANNTNNLIENSSISPTGSVYQDLAGIYVGAASCNVVHSCEMTANATCALQLGSPINTAFNTLTDNLIMNCSVQGTSDCSQSAQLDGLVSYAATTTNLFEGNIVENCYNGFVAATESLDIFLRNKAYNNAAQYVNITRLPVVHASATAANPACNLAFP